MNPARHTPLLIVLLCSTLLVACGGWQLRGAQHAHKPLFQAVSVHGASARLHRALAGELRSTGVAVHGSARYVIKIIDEHLHHRVAAVDNQGREVERELVYQIDWQLVDDETGAFLNPPQHIMSIRSLAHYPNNITASSDEEDVVRGRLFRDVTYRLVNQVANASRKIQSLDQQ